MQVKPGTCNVELDVEEKKWYSTSANTLIGTDGAVSAHLTGRLRNLTGNCEHHSFTIGHGRPAKEGAETEMTYRLRFPRVYGLPVHAMTSVHQLFQSCQAHSSYSERLRGINFDLLGCALSLDALDLRAPLVSMLGTFHWEVSVCLPTRHHC